VELPVGRPEDRMRDAAGRRGPWCLDRGRLDRTDSWMVTEEQENWASAEEGTAERASQAMQFLSLNDEEKAGLERKG
jgi:hypothetical protein